MSPFAWKYDPVPVEQEAYWRAAFARHPGNAYVGNLIYRILKQLDRDREAEIFWGAYGGDSTELLHRFYRDRKTFEIIESPEERPDDIPARLARGSYYQSTGRELDALRDYTRAISQSPTSGQLHAIRASLLATATSEEIRDGRRAKEDAHQAMRLANIEQLLRGDWLHWRFLEVIAAAFAELGEFDTASGILLLPLEQACTKKVRRRYQERIAQFEARQPLRLKSNIMPLKMLSSTSPIPDDWFTG